MFFKYNKEKKTEDLKLAEYSSIWTKFCFLDETGSLAGEKDPYFTVGILKMSQPYYLQSKIIYERSKRNFYDEMKFNKLSKNNIDFCKDVINYLFTTNSIDFYSYTTYKKSWYYEKNFNNNQWEAYKKITLKLLEASISENEILILIADYINTPKEIKFEVDTKKEFNFLKKRLALAGVCRFDSRSNDLLQVVDLVIGAITYDIKFSEKIVTGSKYKIDFLNFVKNKLTVSSFVNGVKIKNFNIFVERTNIN